MSFAALDWAWKVRTGSSGRKAVLMALAQFADDEGVCYPGQDTLARHTELSERSVREHLIWLEAHGFIIRTERRWTDSKKRRTDLYELQIGYMPDPETYRKISPVGGNTQPANSAGSYESGSNAAGVAASVVDVQVPVCAASDDQPTDRQILPVAPTGKSCMNQPADFAGYESSDKNRKSFSWDARSRFFPMAEGWEPDEASLRLPLLTTGLAMAEISPEVVAEFVAHWSTQPFEDTHAGWCKRLVVNLKKHKAHLLAAGNGVSHANRQAPVRRVASGVSLAETLDISWADGLEVL